MCRNSRKGTGNAYLKFYWLKSIYTQKTNKAVHTISTDKYLVTFHSRQIRVFSHPSHRPTSFYLYPLPDYLQTRNGFSAISSSGMVW